MIKPERGLVFENLGSRPETTQRPLRSRVASVGSTSRVSLGSDPVIWYDTGKNERGSRRFVVRPGPDVVLAVHEDRTTGWGLSYVLSYSRRTNSRSQNEQGTSLIFSSFRAVLYSGKTQEGKVRRNEVREKEEKKDRKKGRKEESKCLV